MSSSIYAPVFGKKTEGATTSYTRKNPWSRVRSIPRQGVLWVSNPSKRITFTKENMAQKITITTVIHILEKDFKFKIYKRGKNKYSVWRKGWTAPYGDDNNTARQVHRIYQGMISGIPWNEIVKQQTQSVSRRITRDAINAREFDKIPQHQLPHREDPWCYD
jgi:hypothetical protein